MKNLFIISTLLILGSSFLLSEEECIQGDCVNGYGTYIFSSGDKYVGEWKNSKYHGQGTFTYADGRVEKGIWENGKLVKEQ